MQKMLGYILQGGESTHFMSALYIQSDYKYMFVVEQEYKNITVLTVTDSLDSLEGFVGHTKKHKKNDQF